MDGSSIAVNCCCFTFYCTSVFLIAVFGTILGLGISDSYGDSHLVTTEPQYNEATRLAGYYDGDGVYQGGLPRWQDWSEGSFVCHEASESGTHCQRWSTERYYSDAEQEFLRGNCTCYSPGMDNASPLYLDSAASPAVDAAFESATFCTAWNCEETRFTQACECDEYVTRNTCDDDRRHLRTSRSSRSYGSTRSSGSSCRSYEECVSYFCQYIENPFYTSCNCNQGGEERLEDDLDGLSESSYCQGWTCFQGEERYNYEDYAFNDSWNYNSYASYVYTSSTNVVDPSGNSTETKWIIMVDNELHYNCSKADESGLWCAAWRGVSPKQGDYVEQLCECQNGTTADSLTEGFCEEWSCTSYYMAECNLCSTFLGILLGGLVLFCMIPLVTFGFLGYYRAFTSIPFGLAAAGLLAAFVGGIPAILEGLLAAATLVCILGGLLSKVIHPFDKKKVVPGGSSTAEQKKPEGVASPTTTTVVPPGPNVPHLMTNYGLMMNQPQGQMQPQQTMYSGPLAPGSMPQYGVMYSTTSVNPVGPSQGLTMQGGIPLVGQQQYGGPTSGGSIQGVQPQQQHTTFTLPVMEGYSPSYGSVGRAVYQSSSAHQNMGSYGPGPGYPGGQPLYPGTGGNPPSQQVTLGGQPLHHGPGGSPQHHGVGGPPPHHSPGGSPHHQHGLGGPPPHHGLGGSPQHYGPPPQHGVGSPPPHHGPGRFT